MTEQSVYIKNNVTIHEYIMHKYIYELNIVNVPEIISYDYHNKILTIKKINNMSISDFYGEEITQVPINIIDKIRKIIKKLHDNEIEYPDITGYNFIECSDEIWIIDFEHTKFFDNNNNKSKYYEFIIKFINGLNSWNPEFK